MMDNCTTLYQLSVLPVGNVIHKLEELGIETNPSQSDESLQLELMQIFADNDKLSPYDCTAVNDAIFAKYYLSQEASLNSILENEYYIEGINSFSHLEKVLLVCSLQYEDPEDAKAFLMLLGENINTNNGEVLITSSVMSQPFLNNLLKRTPGYVVDNLVSVIEEYGFSVPQPIVIPESIWHNILSYSSGADVYVMSQVCKYTNRIASNVVLSQRQLIELIRERNNGALNANRKSISKENATVLVTNAVVFRNLQALQIVVDTALSEYGYYEGRYEFIRAALPIILTNGTYEMLLYSWRVFGEYIINAQPQLARFFNKYVSVRNSIAMLSKELEELEGGEYTKTGSHEEDIRTYLTELKKQNDINDLQKRVKEHIQIRDTILRALRNYKLN
jgi:hypothetical protein